MRSAFFAALAFSQAVSPGLAAQPAMPVEPETTLVPLPIAQAAALRCSVAIALAAERQRLGQAAGKDWPDLTGRGREFFVRSLARLMDDTGMGREQLMLYARPEVEALGEPGALEAVMPGCLLMLEASGL